MRKPWMFLGRVMAVMGSLWAMTGSSNIAWAEESPDFDINTLPILENGYTRTGLSTAEVNELLLRGYAVNDILRAEAIGSHYGRPVAELLARHSMGASWEDVAAEFTRSQPAAQSAQRLPEAKLLQVVKQESGLTEEAIAQMRSEGHELLDVLYAQKYAKDYGLTTEQVLRLKKEATWEDVAPNLSIAANLSLPLKVLEDTGLSEQEIKSLLQQGHDLRDLLQAAAIAKASSRTWQEVMELRRERDWKTVAQELIPGGHFPDHDHLTPPPGPAEDFQRQEPYSSEVAPLIVPSTEAPPASEGDVQTQEHQGYYHYHPGYYTYHNRWYPHWHPGYYFWYWYFDWWCWCWRINYVYVPGYIHWHFETIAVYHPGYWHWHPGPVHYDTEPPFTWFGMSPSSPTGTNGWYSSSLSVSLSASDSGGISRTEYMWVDSPMSLTADKVAATSTWSVYTGPLQVPGDGVWRLRYRSIDQAGNYEPTRETATPIRVDRLAPAISGSRTAANTYGWNNTDVTVSFSCSDGVSGVASCTSPATLASEGANQRVTGSAKDMAGNAGSSSVGGINIDKTAPTLSDTRTAANAYGWNNTDVTVSFSCSDALSGVLSCSSPVTLTSEGANQSVTGSAMDRASNSGSSSVGGINIDKTAPVILLTGGGEYTVDQTVRISCTALDNLSGVRSSPCATPLVEAEAYLYNPGTYSASASAMDKADNTGSGSTSYTIVVTVRSLSNLVERFVPATTPGLQGRINSLQSKLRAMEAAISRGNTQAKEGQVGAFINEVQAQNGKALPADKAEVLIRLVRYL